MTPGEQKQRDTDYWRGVQDARDQRQRFAPPPEPTAPPPTLTEPYTGPFLYDIGEERELNEELTSEEERRMHLLNKIYWLTRPFIK